MTVAVGGTGVLVGGTGVAVGGIGVLLGVAVGGGVFVAVKVDVAVGGSGVLVFVEVGVDEGGSGVLVGDLVGVSVAGSGVFVGGTGVLVGGRGVLVGVLVGVAVGGSGVYVGGNGVLVGVDVGVAEGGTGVAVCVGALAEVGVAVGGGKTPTQIVTTKPLAVAVSIDTVISLAGSLKLSPTIHIAPASPVFPFPSRSTTWAGIPRVVSTSWMITASPGSLTSYPA